MKKIPFWRTFGDAFAFVFYDLKRFIRMSVAWVALAIVLFFVVIAILGAHSLRAEPPAASMSGAMHFDLDRVITTLIFALFSVASNIAFAVSWHRAVLVGEIREPLGALRFRGTEWRFLLYSLGVGFLSFGIFLIAALATFGVSLLMTSGNNFTDLHINPWTAAIVAPALMVGMCVMAPFMARFSLGLPAIAVGEPRGVFGRSWHRGYHNGWRLIWGPLFCSFPLGLVSGVFNSFEQLMNFALATDGAWRVIGLVVEAILFALSYWVHFMTLAVAVTFLSLAYRYLTSGETPAPAPLAQTSQS